MTTSTTSSPTSGRPWRGRGERGTGVIGSVMGVLVFLVLLLFAVQVLLGLYATTVVTAAAYDAAKAMAGADRPAPGMAAGVARQRIGPLGHRATFTWDVSQEVVQLTVRAPRPSVLPRTFGLGSADIERTVRVRVEAVR